MAQLQSERKAMAGGGDVGCVRVHGEQRRSTSEHARTAGAETQQLLEQVSLEVAHFEEVKGDAGKVREHAAAVLMLARRTKRAEWAARASKERLTADAEEMQEGVEEQLAQSADESEQQRLHAEQISAELQTIKRTVSAAATGHAELQESLEKQLAPLSEAAEAHDRGARGAVLQ
jgi:hypothetical protein